MLKNHYGDAGLEIDIRIEITLAISALPIQDGAPFIGQSSTMQLLSIEY